MLLDDQLTNIELNIDTPVVIIDRFELLPEIIYKLPTINNEVIEIPVSFELLPFECILTLDNILIPSDTSNTQYGAVSSSFITTIITSGIIPDETVYYGSTSMSVTFAKDVSGTKQTFGQIAVPLTFTKAVSGILISNNLYGSGLYGSDLYGDILTQYGSISRAFTFTKAVSGNRKTFGSITAPFTFTKAVSGTKQTFGQIAAPFTFMKYVAGINVAVNTYYGSIAMPVTFTKAVSGNRQTFGSIAVPLTFTKSVSGTKQTFGQIISPFTFTKAISGTKQTFASITAPFTFTKAVSGIRTGPLQTSVAEISLASHAAPVVRDRHSIKVRARTTSGSGGVIKAALYEGTTNRSGDLTSSALSNTLADYTLTISDASAAAITSYSNLSIKLWGYDPNGSGLVFEVAKIYLELPIN